jgi:hypothetical protein
LRTLLASGILFLTIVLAVSFGIAAGYGVITVLLRLLGWRRTALHSAHAKEGPAPAHALSTAGD